MIKQPPLNIETPEGVAGHRAGALTRRGQRALNTIAPGIPVYEGEPPGAAEFARGAAHMAVGSRGLGTFHVMRGLMDRLPQHYQQELAEGLLARDPARIHETLGNLRKAGTDLQSIRQLSLGVSGILGANTAAATMGTTKTDR